MAQKNCIKCHATIDYDAGFCLFCGTAQPGGQITKKAASSGNGNTLKKPGQKLRVPVAVKREQESEEEKKHPAQTDLKKKEKKLSKEKMQEEKETENLMYVAYHDPLTGAKNRQAYEKDLENISQKDICAISVDCNNLKNTNDTKGHKYGDILLVTVAESLMQVFADHVYRMGGDEFLVLLDGEGEKVVQKKIHDFYDLLEYKKNRMEEELEVEAAVGIAFGDGIKSIKEVLDEADRLMYQNKKDMKNKVKPIEPIENNPLPLPVQPQPEDEKEDDMQTTIKEYDPNYDGYYDDTEEIIEEEEKRFAKESLKKALLLVGAFFVFLIIYFYIFF